MSLDVFFIFVQKQKSFVQILKKEAEAFSEVFRNVKLIDMILYRYGDFSNVRLPDLLADGDWDEDWKISEEKNSYF